MCVCVRAFVWGETAAVALLCVMQVWVIGNVAKMYRGWGSVLSFSLLFLAACGRAADHRDYYFRHTISAPVETKRVQYASDTFI